MFDHKQYYQDNKETIKENNRRNKQTKTAENIAWRNDYLAEHPCVDCGESDTVINLNTHNSDGKFTAGSIEIRVYA